MTATNSADPAIPSIPWRGSGYYVEALHGQQPCGDHVLERIFVAVRWYGSPTITPNRTSPPSLPRVSTPTKRRCLRPQAPDPSAPRHCLIRHEQALYSPPPELPPP